MRSQRTSHAENRKHDATCMWPDQRKKKKRFTAGQRLYVKGTKAKDKKLWGGSLLEGKEGLAFYERIIRTAPGGSLHGEAVATQRQWRLNFPTSYMKKPSAPRRIVHDCRQDSQSSTH